MSWRENFIRRFGPGLLGGVRLGDYLKLLIENRFAIPPSCWFRALTVLGQSAQNTSLSWLERFAYGKHVYDVAIEPPLFLLGHWRSGTTHLHNLLALDERFGFPNNYQVLFPHGFLTWERFGARAIGYFMPERRPMDNMTWSIHTPQEEEFALMLLSLRSQCLSWVFPQNRARYDRYLTFRGVPEREIREWQAAFVWFLKRLTWKVKRPLVLKSPQHTARIKLLLETFPGAKFIHIHRDPYVVFQSMYRTLDIQLEFQRLQGRSSLDLEPWILQQYRTMYDAFFAERDLIPAGQFHEIAFEDLERDPLGQLRGAYQALGLPEFAELEPKLTTYVESLHGYRKNDHPPLSTDLRAKIAREWRQNFIEWGYST